MTQHIWIIDDDRSIRWVLEKALGKAGLEVTSFSSANGVMEALEGPVKLAECISGEHDDSSGDTCSLLAKCPIAGPMHRVHRRIRDMLKELTLQDILPPHVVRRAEASA